MCVCVFVLFHPIRMILPNMFQQQQARWFLNTKIACLKATEVDLMNPQQGVSLSLSLCIYPITNGEPGGATIRGLNISQAHDSQNIVKHGNGQKQCIEDVPVSPAV